MAAITPYVRLRELDVTENTSAAIALRVRHDYEVFVKQLKRLHVSHIRINGSAPFVSRAFRTYDQRRAVNIHLYVEQTSDEGSVKLVDTGFSGARIRLLQSFKVARDYAEPQPQYM